MAAATQRVIDAHIHLWPPETSNQDGHPWMTPGMPLAKPHLMKEYYAASGHSGASNESGISDVEVRGVVFIETDVRYAAPSDDISDWAKGPLDEVCFLRNVIEGKYGARDGNMVLGLVPWAPMDQPTHTLEKYLRLAEERAGPVVWQRVRGFRYLLQFIRNPSKFEQLVFSRHFILNLKLLGKRGFSFDIGVDQRSGGIWQLQKMAKVMHLAHEGVPEDEQVVFILNHLCKPDLPAGGIALSPWAEAVSKMSACPKTYMKLSGALSELPDAGPKSAAEIAEFIKPWLKHVFATFGPNRVMFGSDWPVCNVKGPAGEKSWAVWKDAVKLALDDDTYGLGDDEIDNIWHGNAARVYRLPSGT